MNRLFALRESIFKSFFDKGEQSHGIASVGGCGVPALLAVLVRCYTRDASAASDRG
jgi:hypothetical protein